MSIKEITRVWDESKQKGANLLTMLALADWANEDGVSWYGQSRIARRARVSKRQINNILDQCVAQGEIVRVQRSGQLSTIYCVMVGLDADEQSRRVKIVNRFEAVLNPITLVKPTSLGSETGDITPSEIASSPDPLVDPLVDPSDIPAGANDGPRPKKSRLDPNGIPINNQHPRWESLWNAVVALARTIGEDVTDPSVKGRISNVVAKLIAKPGVVMPADVARFHAWAVGHGWGTYTVEAIPKWIHRAVNGKAEPGAKYHRKANLEDA